MDPKKQRIIEESMKLFSEQGFHTTSIQEIVDKSEVSKGSFYLHFQSKNDLIVEIYNYYSNLVLQRLASAQSETGEPLQKFTRQIEVFLALFQEHKEFLMMHVRDNVHLGEQMNDIIISHHKQSYSWIKEQLHNIYGAEVEPYQVDIAIQVDGLLSGYFKWIAIHNKQFQVKQLATYITGKIDWLARGIIEEKAKPIFTEKDLTLFTTKTKDQDAIHSLKRKIAEMEPKNKQAATEALTVLEEEWNKKEPKNIIIQSMLDHLAAYPALKTDIHALKK